MESTMTESVTLRPILDQVIVELEAPGEKQTAGGIVLPDIATRGKAVPSEPAVVCAVGPGRVSRKGALIAPEVSVGERVLISRHLGTELADGPRRFVVIRACHILGVMA